MTHYAASALTPDLLFHPLAAVTSALGLGRAPSCVDEFDSDRVKGAEEG
jgi:hypothetical protein